MSRISPTGGQAASLSDDVLHGGILHASAYCLRGLSSRHIEQYGPLAEPYIGRALGYGANSDAKMLREKTR